jgi:hypothetical protein
VKIKIDYTLTKDQLWKFIMVLFAMGLAPQPTVDHYWKKPEKTHGMYGNLYISHLLSRDEFWAINKMIHCNIETTVNMLNKRYQKYSIFFSVGLSN